MKSIEYLLRQTLRESASAYSCHAYSGNGLLNAGVNRCGVGRRFFYNWVDQLFTNSLCLWQPIPKHTGVRALGNQSYICQTFSSTALQQFETIAHICSFMKFWKFVIIRPTIAKHVHWYLIPVLAVCSHRIKIR